MREQIQYISWHYGKVRTHRGVEQVHLVRLKSGQGLLLTDRQMVKRGLAEWRV